MTLSEFQAEAARILSDVAGGSTRVSEAVAKLSEHATGLAPFDVDAKIAAVTKAFNLQPFAAAMLRSILVCPSNDPLHFADGGCPSCKA